MHFLAIKVNLFRISLEFKNLFIVVILELTTFKVKEVNVGVPFSVKAVISRAFSQKSHVKVSESSKIIDAVEAEFSVVV